MVVRISSVRSIVKRSWVLERRPEQACAVPAKSERIPAGTAQACSGLQLQLSSWQSQLVGRHKNVFMLELDRKSEFLAHLFQVGLHHANVPSGGDLDLADQDELVAGAIPVEI